MRKIISKTLFIIQTVILITVFLLLSACDRSYKYTPYVEGTTFELKNYEALKTPSALNGISLGQGVSVEGVDFSDKKVVVKKDDLYGLMDFDGNVVYETENDLIQNYFGGFVVYKGNSTKIDFFSKKIHIEFSGYAKILYNGLIAYYPSDDIRIDVMDLHENVLYSIYDEYRTDKIINYGKYLIYENGKFGVYQVFDEYGNNVFEYNDTTRNELYYVYSDRLLYVGVTEHNGVNVWTNKVFDLKTKEELPTFRSVIYTVSNRGTGNVNLSDGYNLLGTDEGFMYANSDFSAVFPLYSASFSLIDGYGTYYDVQSGSLFIVNEDLNTINEISSVVDFSTNGQYLTYAKQIQGQTKYGIMTMYGKTIFEPSFDHISTMVSGKAIAYNIENGTKKYFILGSDKSVTRADDDKLFNTSGGIYYYILDETLYVYNFDGKLLLQKENAYVQDVDVVYGNSSYLTVVDDEDRVYLYTFIY